MAHTAVGSDHAAIRDGLFQAIGNRHIAAKQNVKRALFMPCLTAPRPKMERRKPYKTAYIDFRQLRDYETPQW